MGYDGGGVGGKVGGAGAAGSRVSSRKKPDESDPASFALKDCPGVEVRARCLSPSGFHRVRSSLRWSSK